MWKSGSYCLASMLSGQSPANVATVALRCKPLVQLIPGDLTMTPIDAGRRTAFFSLLAAPGRAGEIPESADAYGWLIGSWELDVRHYRGVDVAARGIKGEAHFGWVLEGRAVQDVWIMPRRLECSAE